MILADEFRAALAEASIEIDAERFAEGVRRGGKIFAASDVFVRLGGKLAGHVVTECKYMAPGTIVAVKEPTFDWWGTLRDPREGQDHRRPTRRRRADRAGSRGPGPRVGESAADQGSGEANAGRTH